MDLNCDMGESFGAYRLGNDAEVLRYVTSANIACGFHAGDPQVMQATVRLAGQAGVCIGAHPGYPDLQGFGRRALEMNADEVEALVLYQIGALAGFCRAEGVELVHVKPHGALYNQAAKDRALALAVARATVRFSRSLVLVGLAGSALLAAGEEVGLCVAGEGFPDRAYQPDGSLRPRRLLGAVLESPEEAAAQALQMALHGVTVTRDGRTETLRVDTLCIHGDNPHAADEARMIRLILEQNGVSVD
jgi:UPF0271 protein